MEVVQVKKVITLVVLSCFFLPARGSEGTESAKERLINALQSLAHSEVIFWGHSGTRGKIGTAKELLTALQKNGNNSILEGLQQLDPHDKLLIRKSGIFSQIGSIGTLTQASSSNKTS